MKRTSPYFFAIPILLLVTTHAGLYAALISIFSVTGPGGRTAVAAGLSGLTALFIVAMAIGSRVHNAATRILYTVSSAWLGFFFYLLLASIAYGIANLALLPFVAQGTIHMVGIILVAVAIITGIAALINARILRTTHVTVKLPNTPESWKSRKAVFFSDIHLGQVYQHRFAKKLADRISSLNPNVVLIGGDLFDGLAVDPLKAAAPLGDIKSEFGTYFIMGNHDEIKGPGRYLKAVRELGITTLINESVVLDGLHLFGADYRTTISRDEFARTLRDLTIPGDEPSILVKHVPNDLDIAEQAGISLHLSGHTHRGQLFPLSLVTNRVFKGYDYGLGLLNGMHVFTSSGSGGWGPSMRLGTRSEVVLISFE